jgi:hypothetical protein
LVRQDEAETRAADRDDTVYHSVYLGLALFVLALAFALEVRGNERVAVPMIGLTLPDSCWFRHLTGIGCPGCGLTRCFISLAHGEFVRAWSFNPAGFVFFALVVGQIPYRSLQIWRVHRNLPQWRPITFGTIATSLLGVLLLLQWLYRWAS